MALPSGTRWDKGIQQMTIGTNKQESGDLIGAAHHYDIGIQMLIDHLKTMPQSDRKLVKQAKVESYMDILENVKLQIQETNPQQSQKFNNRIAKPQPRNQPPRNQPKQRAMLPKPKPRNRNNNSNNYNNNNTGSNGRRRSNSNNRGGAMANRRNSNPSAISNAVNRNRSKSETELYNKIMSEVVSNNSEKVTFNDVIGLENVKQVLFESVILPAQRPDIFTGPRAPPRGLLLFGPPGNGKTFIAKALASECNATFFSISASSLTSRYVGESEKLVRALFEAARDNSPSIIFIDEIDSILTSRGGDNEQESSRRMKTEFLVQMDGVSSGTGKERVLLVGATNLPWQLDDAVLRRFERRILVPLPDEEQRKFIIMSKLKNDGQISYKLSDKDITNIVRATEGYSASDLKNLVRDACMGPVRDLGMNVAKVKKVPPVKYEHFLNSLENVRASSNNRSLNQFNQWNDEFGSKLKFKNSQISSNNSDISMIGDDNNINNNDNNDNDDDDYDYEMKSQANDSSVSNGVNESNGVNNGLQGSQGSQGSQQSQQSPVGQRPSGQAPSPPKSKKSKKWGFSLFT